MFGKPWQMGLVLLYVTLAFNFNITFLCPPTLPNPFVDTIAKPHLTYIKQNATFESKMCENFSWFWYTNNLGVINKGSWQDVEKTWVSR